jgi:amidophosphoribosyltransferase
VCGLCGVILSPGRRSPEDWSVITNIFTDLLLANEVRGRHASGVATVASDGRHQLYKAPVPASDLIEHPKYWSVVGGVNERTTILMGHTRWPTVGDLRPANCQPLRTGHLVSTTNGTVTNHRELASRYGIKRIGQVDSEVLFRLALRAWSRRGWAGRMVDLMGEIEGTAAVITVSKERPEEVLLLRRGRPLSLASVPELQAVFYVSERWHLVEGLRGLDWRSFSLEEGRLARVNATTLPKVRRYSLEVPTYF